MTERRKNTSDDIGTRKKWKFMKTIIRSCDVYLTRPIISAQQMKIAVQYKLTCVYRLKYIVPIYYNIIIIYMINVLFLKSNTVE